MKKISLIAALSSILMITGTGLYAQGEVSIQPTTTTSAVDVTEVNTSMPLSSGITEGSAAFISEPAPSVEPKTSLAVSTTLQPTAQPEIFQTQAISNVNAENNPLASVVAVRSIRSKESEVPHARVSIVENGARGTSYDPLNPYRVERYETQLIYEYFPRPEVSLGVIPVFLKAHYSYKLSPDTDSLNSAGIVPFASYLFTPNWLGTAQGGYYYENHSWLYPQFTGSPPDVSLRQQAHRFFGALYMTWIGPPKCISGSVRAGALYEYQHMKTAVDSVGDLQPGSNFERGGVSISGRLKYVPADKWELYFQTELGYSLKITRRDTDFRAGGGRQSLRFLAGPGIHYSISPASEFSLTYFSVQGYGFYRENQVSLRLRLLL